MNFSNICSQISNTIAVEIALDDEKKEIVSYAVETVILSISGILLVIIVSSLFKVLLPALIAAFVGGSLRRLSGGAHFNSPLKCLLSGAIIYTFIGILSEQIIRLGLTQLIVELPIVIFSLITAGTLAPVESQGKPIHSQRLKFILKTLSVTFILILFIAVSICPYNLLKVSSLLGMSYQCITLFPIFNRKEVG